MKQHIPNHINVVRNVDVRQTQESKSKLATDTNICKSNQKCIDLTFKKQQNRTII